MSEFKTSDFVQVEHEITLPGGEPATLWRNALYTYTSEQGCHAVTYSDGSREMINNATKIRRAVI